MAFVKKGDVFVPEMLEDALQGAFAGATVMRGTGAAIFKTGMPAGKSQVGEQIKVPYFGNIGELEDLTNDGDALTPRGISDSIELATVKHSGIAIEATWWAQASAAADPYAEMARQIVMAIERRADKAILDAASAVASSSNDVLTKDVYNSGSPRTLDYDLVVDGRQLWGDEEGDIASLVMHSKVKGDAFKLKDTQGRPLLLQASDGNLDRFLGIPIVPTDRLTASSDSPPKYTTLMLKRGSLVFWMASHPGVKVDEDILADTQVAAVHIYWACHRYKRMPSGTKPGIVRLIHN